MKLGMSGSGKSVGIADEIADSIRTNPLGPRIYWIVPALASYTTERLLLDRVEGTVRAEIIHLNRLAQRANEALHSVSGTDINDTGKRLLLASVYQNSVGELEVLGRVNPSIGILDGILEVFDEMSQFAVSPQQIEAQLEIAAARLDDMHHELAAAVSGKSLLGKLRDLSLLYVRYQRELNQRSLYDKADLPGLVAPGLSAWAELEGATIYVDGFADIVPRDALFIVQLARYALRTVVTLNLPLSLSETWRTNAAVPSFFDGVTQDSTTDLGAWYSFRRLTLLAEQEGLELEFVKAPTSPEDGRFRDSPDLSRLEALLRNQDGKQGAGSALAPGHLEIELAGAQNIRTETDAVAEAIAIHHTEEATPFSEFVALVPDLETYADHLRDSFDVYQIPYSIDEYPGMIEHPLTKFVLASLLVIEEGFSVESIHRLLKTDFCGLQSRDADWLEPYLTQYEVEGETLWLSGLPWTCATDVSEDRTQSVAKRADERAEALRQSLLTWLRPFSKSLSMTMQPAAFAEALWQLFSAVEAKKTVANWMANEGREEHSFGIQTEKSALNPLEGSLHEQAWLKWIALMDDLSQTQVVSSLPREFLFSLVFEECLHQSLTTIPEGIQQVRVMTYQHALAWEAEHVFVLGATDGTLPKRASHRGLLQDDERRQFLHLFGQGLGYTKEERQHFERWQEYRVLTRARRKLTLSSPLSGQDGKAVRPSLLFQQLTDWFGPRSPWHLWVKSPWLDVKTHRQETEDVPVSIRPMQRVIQDLLPMLRAGTIPASWGPLLNSILASCLAAPTSLRMLEYGIHGLAHRTGAKPLSDELMRKLYPSQLKANVYQLETFAACSFRHFAQYILRIQPEQLPDITPAHRGTLIHDALQKLVEEQMKNPGLWKQSSDEEVLRETQRVFDEVMSLPSAQIWQRKLSRREQASATLSLLQRAALVLTRHLKYSEFTPATVELSFGDKDDNMLPLLTIPLQNGREVALRGRLDRIDIAGHGKEKVFRVIDYKSSELDLDPTRIDSGLRLQLAVYGLAAAVYGSNWAGEEVRLTGLFYFPVTTHEKATASPQTVAQAQAEHFKSMRARGWMVEDADVIDWMDSRLSANQSDLFKKVFKADGTLAKTAPVLSDQAWKQLLGRVLTRVVKIAEDILAGSIDIQPFRLGTEEACTFCPYQSVCQVDRRFDGSVFRVLDSLSRDAIDDWQEDAVALSAWMQDKGGQA